LQKESKAFGSVNFEILEKIGADFRLLWTIWLNHQATFSFDNFGQFAKTSGDF
jgi:hypothetical protein